MNKMHGLSSAPTLQVIHLPNREMHFLALARQLLILAPGKGAVGGGWWPVWKIWGGLHDYPLAVSHRFSTLSLYKCLPPFYF